MSLFQKFSVSDDGLHPYVGDDGAFLGDHTPLLQKDAAGWFSLRPRAELEILLSLGYGVDVDLSDRMENFRLVAKALNARDYGRAQIALLHTQLPPLPSRQNAVRMQAMDGLMAKDMAWLHENRDRFGRWIADLLSILAPSAAAAAATVAQTPAKGSGGAPAKMTPEQIKKNAEFLFAETRGLYPKAIDPNKENWKASNWEKTSADQLKEARQALSIISDRNPRVTRLDGSRATNSPEKQAWKLSVDAATTKNEVTLPPDVKWYYIRNADKHGNETAPEHRSAFPAARYYKSYGPFYAIGGGDAGKGQKIYVDLYRLNP